MQRLSIFEKLRTYTKRHFVSLIQLRWQPLFFYLRVLSDPKPELKPLDVSGYCKAVFEKCAKTLIMSATILDHKVFCRNIGLNPDNVKFIRIPSDFSLDHRPIIPLN